MLRWVVFFCLSVGSLCVSATPLRILMIGNSLTISPGTENSPEVPILLQGLFRSCGVRAEIDYSVYGGNTLEMHVNRGEIQRMLLAKKYDFVIVQPFSVEALELPDCITKQGVKGQSSFLTNGEIIVNL